MKIHNVIIALIAMATHQSAWAAIGENDASAIERAFSPTNRIATVEELIYPVFTNCWFGSCRDNRAYVRELNYTILTNACLFKTNDVEYWSRSDMQSRALLFHNLFFYECSREDLDYIEKVADFIGVEMQPQPTSEYSFRAPMRVRIYNSKVKPAREMLIEYLPNLFRNYERLLTDDELASFRTNIITRARLTPEEQRILWPVE